MKDCEIEPGKHAWFVIGHSSGPGAILFLHCAYCGHEWRLHLTQERWSDYLNELNEAGMRWVARYLGLPKPFVEEPLNGDVPF